VFRCFPDESDLRLFFVPVFSAISTPSGVSTADVPAFPDVSVFSVATTLLVGIDHTGWHRPSRSTSIILLIGVNPSGRHLIGPSAGIDLPVGSSQPSR
jgi:hypothetical protein